MRNLRPEASDISRDKDRVIAFVGTDLELLLRATEVDMIVLFAIATSGVVLSTLLQASDADCKIVVTAGCCTDRDAELHSVLLERLFPSRANIIATGDFVKVLESR